MGAQRQVNQSVDAFGLNPPPESNPSVSEDALTELHATQAGQQEAQAAINAGRGDDIGSKP